MNNQATWKEYLDRFEKILSADVPETPYDNRDYFNYLKLNASRQKRWLKKAEIDIELKNKVDAIQQEQTWYIITEPWCGDAAHSIPFIYLLIKDNKYINIKFIWRDVKPYMIDNYLTNGGKSVPKLIVRDKDENDIFTWGPRPEACQNLYLDLKEKNADFEEMKIKLQQWYNKDKGESLQAEFKDLIGQLSILNSKF